MDARRHHARAAAAALTAGDVWVLVRLAPSTTAAGRITRLRGWVADAGPDRVLVALAGAALWLAAAWLALALLCTALTRVPGPLGRAASAVSARIAPALVRRLVGVTLAGAAGAGIVAAAAVPAVAQAPTVAHAPSATATSSPAPGWPTQDALPAPGWPATTPSNTAPRTTTPSVPGVAPPRRHPANTAAGVIDHRVVTVHAGDSLWSIAADHLPARATPAQVASAWPRWYAANRQVIGTDPNLIVPGEQLRPPAPHAATTAASDDPSTATGGTR